MALGSPLLAADCKENIELSADYVKLRCPEGLDQFSIRVIGEDQVLSYIFFKKAMDSICLANIYTNISCIITC